MHIEVQVALNFVISYLYNKLPRRRVNLFGEELEKALKDKFQGHWYPEKPFKGSAFRCLKTGDPIDQVLEKAARESGVPISDILENLPAELSVWVDPGEVSYRIGEKGAVKILFSEHHDHPEESSSADREVTKTFNPEAQCFRPIDAVSNSMNGLSLSPKTSPQQGTSPTTSTTSPTFKSTTTGHINTSPNIAAGTFLPRTQAPVTFTTATFAQTKFGSTKLKTSSKRANSSYRMSPTEFSNYIKQRAMQQQLHHSHIPNNHFGPIGSSSPSRSLSPNPLTLSGGIQQNDPFYFPTNLVGIYPPQFGNNSGGSGGGNIVNGGTNNSTVNGSGGGGVGNNTVTSGNGIVQNGTNAGHRNLFDTTHFHTSPETGNNVNGIYNNTTGNNGHIGNGSKFSTYMEPHGFYGQPPLQMQQQNGSVNSTIIVNGNNNNNNNNTNNTNITGNNSNNNSGVANGGINNGTNNIGGNVTPVSSPGSNQDSSKLIDGLNSFYSSTGPYQHLLVAN